MHEFVFCFFASFALHPVLVCKCESNVWAHIDHLLIHLLNGKLISVHIIWNNFLTIGMWRIWFQDYDQYASLNDIHVEAKDWFIYLLKIMFWFFSVALYFVCILSLVSFHLRFSVVFFSALSVIIVFISSLLHFFFIRLFFCPLYTLLNWILLESKWAKAHSSDLYAFFFVIIIVAQRPY